MRYITKYIPIIAIMAMLTCLSAFPILATAATLEEEYTTWKSSFVVQNGANADEFRVKDPRSNDSTVSEGQGYGMLLAVENDDKTAFDGLWKYIERNRNKHGLMHWKIDKNGVILGENGATDADEDIGYALLLATRKWGEAYAPLARTYIDAIYQFEVEKDTYVLKPGDVWGGSDATNPSYYSPTYYKEFYNFTGNNGWLRVNDKAYEILFLARDPETGLIPEWTTASGTPSARITWNKNKDNFSYNAIRIPWRIATDFILSGDARAHAILSLMNSFFEKTASPKSGYTLEGQPLVSYLDTAFMAGIVSAGLVSDDPSVRSSAEQALIERTTTDYYGATLRMLVLGLIDRMHTGVTETTHPVTIATASTASSNTPAVETASTTRSASSSTATNSSSTAATSTHQTTNDGGTSVPASSSNTVREITVIYPGNSTLVSGEKKLKILIDDLPLSAYRATYSVDGGTLVPMENTTSGHKQSKVFFDDWTWNGSGPYTITFTAYDTVTDKIIATTSSIIFVKH